MNKGINCFYPKSKGFLRMLMLCIVACLSFSQARADYYYRVKLADNNGIIHQIGGNDWSAWIHVNLGSGIINALNKLIGGEIQEQEKENDGRLKNRVMMYLDEFGTIPKIEGAEMMFSASRSRRVSIVAIMLSSTTVKVEVHVTHFC